MIPNVNKQKHQNMLLPWILEAIKTEADKIFALICKSIGGKAEICNTKDIK